MPEVLRRAEGRDHSALHDRRQRDGEREPGGKMDEEIESAGGEQILAQLHGARGAAGLSGDRSTGQRSAVRSKQGRDYADVPLRISERLQQRFRRRALPDTRVPLRSEQHQGQTARLGDGHVADRYYQCGHVRHRHTTAALR